MKLDCVKFADVTNTVVCKIGSSCAVMIEAKGYTFDCSDSRKNWFVSECGKGLVGSGVVYKALKSQA